MPATDLARPMRVVRPGHAGFPSLADADDAVVGESEARRSEQSSTVSWLLSTRANVPGGRADSGTGWCDGICGVCAMEKAVKVRLNLRMPSVSRPDRSEIQPGGDPDIRQSFQLRIHACQELRATGVDENTGQAACARTVPPLLTPQHRDQSRAALAV
jgi:hypothetical protein